MKDQLLDGAGLRVLRCPGFELLAVMEKQLSQVAGILGVVLGPAGDEGLAVFLQRDGVDGIKGDPIVGLQEGNEVGGGLFEAQAQACRGVLLAQGKQPFPEGLGSGVDAQRGTLASGHMNEVEVGFTIRTIQADNQVKRMGWIHKIEDVIRIYLWPPADLTQRRQYRRVVSVETPSE